MRIRLSLLTLLAVFTLPALPAQGARPAEDKKQADYIVTGTVTAVYVRDAKGYRQYIVEIEVDKVEKGTGLKSGDTFRAKCYQRKEGYGGLQYDTSGHKAIPKEGQRIKAFVKDGHGYHEAIYPDWFEVIREAGQ